MPTKIWLKPEQLELYIKQLERFRDLYSQLDQTLESDRQGFAYRDLDLLIKGTDRNTESGLNKIEEQLYKAKRQIRERNL